MGLKDGRPTRRRLREVVGEVGPDDGVDPRVPARARVRQHRTVRPGPPPGARVAGRKARQLGRQVAEALDAALAGEARDPTLGALRVVAAAPAPDASRLLVTVAPRSAADRPALHPAGVAARLAVAAGWLRAEAAAAVHRKRAPALAFRFTPDPDDAG